MEYGICLMSLGQIRHLPDERSELVTQILFGETLRVLERKGKWLQIQLLNDNYIGWISAGQIRILQDDEYETLAKASLTYSNDLIQVLENQTRKTSMLITAGSQFFDCQKNAFQLLGEQYLYHGYVSHISGFTPTLLTGNALLFLNSPYLWGGRSALGIDCSGFTQVVYKISGKLIPRDASQQAQIGEVVNFIHEAQQGDLLFFDNDEGIITHVGIMLNENSIIHAHNHVRIDRIDHQGIYNEEQKKYSHKLRIIKRI